MKRLTRVRLELTMDERIRPDPRGLGAPLSPAGSARPSVVLSSGISLIGARYAERLRRSSSAPAAGPRPLKLAAGGGGLARLEGLEQGALQRVGLAAVAQFACMILHIEGVHRPFAV